MKRGIWAFSGTLSALLLLSAVAFMQWSEITVLGASPDLHQGDLILTGNNVTIIEGGFYQNGSITIEENATLILRNTVLNFTQSHSNQFHMNIQNPLGGRPRLIIENATITSSYSLYVQFYSNSSMNGDALFASSNIRFFLHDSSNVSLSNSSSYELHAYSYSIVTTSDSYYDWLVGEGHSKIAAENCTLETVRAGDNANITLSECEVTYDIISEVFSANCSINNLQSGVVNYWNLGMNSSIIVAPAGWAPNFTLLNTEIYSWSFILSGLSNATISNCKLTRLGSEESATEYVYNSTNDGWISGKDFSTCYIYGTSIDLVEAHDNSTLWLVNSTYRSVRLYGVGKIHVSWYLDVHVLDSIGQNVPSANVTAYPSLLILFNLTIYESELTDENGLARLILLEKMMNATAEYSIGNYTVGATYETYSADTSVNMTENRQITLVLEDFVIPEFPSTMIVLVLICLTLVMFIMTHTYRRPRLGDFNG